MPRVQSSGVEQEVKAVRRVTDTERWGSSGLSIGGKRVSSYALFNVYTGKIGVVVSIFFVCFGVCD